MAAADGGRRKQVNSTHFLLLKKEEKRREQVVRNGHAILIKTHTKKQREKTPITANERGREGSRLVPGTENGTKLQGFKPQTTTNY
jgi:hypothetical protein